MRKPFSSAEERSLQKQLQREANESWPIFSETLHRQILSAVERCRATEPAAPRRRSFAAHWSIHVAAACAAVCLLCALVVGWRWSGRDESKPTEQIASEKVAQDQAMLASLPSINELAGGTAYNLRELAVSTVVDPYSADLKHDARLTAETLLRQLPVDMEMFSGTQQSTN